MLSGRGRTNRHSALSVLYKAAALVAMSFLIILCLSGNILAVDLTKPNSLTVNIQEGFKDDEGLQNEDLIVELYKVAEARDDIEPAKGYDTYTLVTEDAFSDLQEAIDKAQVNDPEAKDRWNQIAQQAVMLVRDGRGGTPIAAGNTGAIIGDLPAGLYLVVTHGMEEPYYFDDEGQGPVLTMAHSDRYEYHFIPQLIALPFAISEEGTEEIFNTADAHGNWGNKLTIVLKGERKEIPEPEEESDVPPDEKPGTGDKSGIFTQKIFFFSSGIVILVLAIVLATMKKRD